MFTEIVLFDLPENEPDALMRIQAGPVLWRPAETPEADTAAGAVYLFSVWAGLILLSFLLSRWLPEGDEAGRDGDGADDGAS